MYISNTRMYLVVITLLLITLLLMYLVLSCCGQSEIIDVSGNKLFWGGYDPNCFYELKIDVFLIDEGGMHISPERNSKYWRGATVPFRMDDSVKHYNIFNYGHVKGIIKAGTLIKPETLERHVGSAPIVDGWDMLQPTALIISGPYKDMTVNLIWVSDYGCGDEPDPTPPNPHPEMLSKIQNTQL